MGRKERCYLDEEKKRRSSQTGKENYRHYTQEKAKVMSISSEWSSVN